MRERMLAGDLYIADDPELAQDSARARALAQRFNTMDPNDSSGCRSVLVELLGAFGEGSEIRPPFWCDYGYQTTVGARTFINFGLVSLDVASVTIGDDCLIGTDVLALAGALDGDLRRLPCDRGVGAGHLRLVRWKRSSDIAPRDHHRSRREARVGKVTIDPPVGRRRRLTWLRQRRVGVVVEQCLEGAAPAVGAVAERRGQVEVNPAFGDRLVARRCLCATCGGLRCRSSLSGVMVAGARHMRHRHDRRKRMSE